MVKIDGTASTNRILELETGSSQGSAGTQIMTVQGNGSVGIDTTTMTTTFNIGGGEYATGNIVANSCLGVSNGGGNTCGGYTFYANGPSYIGNTLQLNGALEQTQGNYIYPGADSGNYQTSYYLYDNTGNSGIRTNGNFLASGNIYWGSGGNWLSGYLNQAVLTSSAPTFGGLTISGNESVSNNFSVGTTPGAASGYTTLIYADLQGSYYGLDAVRRRAGGSQAASSRLSRTQNRRRFGLSGAPSGGCWFIAHVHPLT